VVGVQGTERDTIIDALAGVGPVVGSLPGLGEEMEDKVAEQFSVSELFPCLDDNLLKGIVGLCNKDLLYKLLLQLNPQDRNKVLKACSDEQLVTLISDALK
jgi:hypothetical protein